MGWIDDINQHWSLIDVHVSRIFADKKLNEIVVS